MSVGAGANHSACVVANGTVFSWGHAEYNQQGVAGVCVADVCTFKIGAGAFVKLACVFVEFCLFLMSPSSTV